MRDFLDIVFSFPTVVFTASTIILLGFWTVTSLIGAGTDALEDFDFDLDADVEVDVDLELDGADLADGAGANADAGLVRTALQFLGIGTMPLLLALNLESLFAWLASVTAMTLLGGPDGLGGMTNTGGVAIRIVVLVASFLAGLSLTKAIGRRWSHVFKPTYAQRQRQFVGAICTITTERVTADFGQAEVRDDEGGSLIVQVRCAKTNDFVSGDRALIYDLADGIFQISPDRSLAP